ncbi:MAG: hypothetical protein ACOC8Q_02400 [Desulfosalsimonas sp.]
MKFNWLKIIVISIALIITSSAANAFDYQDWIPLLPENIGEMEKTDEPSGMNREESGQSWSVLEQKYSDKQGNSLSLTILTGSDAPGIKEFKMMQQFNKDTEEETIKPVDVQGLESVLAIDKKGGENSLLIPAADKTLVIISTSAFDSEDEMISLADDVPVEDIADSIE